MAKGQGAGRSNDDGVGSGFICCVSCAVIFIVLGVMAMYICAIVYGSIHVNNCDEKMIPIYIIVTGAIGCLQMMGLGSGKSEDGRQYTTIFGFLIALFQIAWNIYGAILVYPYDKGPGYAYCDKDAYLMAFWCATIHLIIYGLVIVCTICLVATGLWGKIIEKQNELRQDQETV
jgi:hypothetical protein